ncbi:hypothetical protein [Pedomonas sp. V897]|uniref:hypothetical protein n=1 Tax=Pedomonas sp. V897 TaxID=3446482 RepID=UPI003EE23723
MIKVRLVPALAILCAIAGGITACVTLAAPKRATLASVPLPDSLQNLLSEAGRPDPAEAPAAARDAALADGASRPAPPPR